MIRVRKSLVHGLGVFSTQKIPKGMLIIHYAGQKISKKTSQRRERRRGDQIWIFELNSKWDIDAFYGGNDARFINHSCNPNCSIEILKNKIWIKSDRVIQVGEEITFNYGFDLFEGLSRRCHCGQKGCLGFIICATERKNLKKILRELTAA